MVLPHFDAPRHPLHDPAYRAECRSQLDTEGVVVLDGFFRADTIARVRDQSRPRIGEAFYTTETHNVYLTPPDPGLADNHPFNRQVNSSKGCLTDVQVDAGSPLREIYDSPEFRSFLGDVLGVDELHPYADDVSSINVHFASDGQELGWHFDNSSFSVTMLIQAPEGGGEFQYVPGGRDADAGEMNFDGVGAVLDGRTSVRVLDFSPGALVFFRGRNSLHRVTPTEGSTPRILVVFAYNTEPGVGLSASAKETFYGIKA